MSQVRFSKESPAHKPSNTIFKDCPNTLLNDLSLGHFRAVEFLGTPTGTLASALSVNQWAIGDAFKLSADTDTVITQLTTVNGGIGLETDGDDNDGVALFSAPIGKIVPRSGKKLWLEGRIAHVDVSEDYGAFFGLVEQAGATHDVVADNAASNAVVGESLMGFLRDNGDVDAWDIVTRKDADTVKNVLDDATNSSKITDGSGASLTDGAYFKLGIKFDGVKTLAFFVNGFIVAEVDVTDTANGIDLTKDLSVILALKTGTAAAENLNATFLRYAYQEYSG